jgi:DNA-binding transcriptional LysR family regulator
MRIFVAVAEAGSLSAAARRLGLPLATVSRRLAGLEEEVGARLVARTTRRLTLSEPGRRYLEACRRILEQLDEADRLLVGARAQPQGTLAVTAPIVFGRLHVLPIVADFLHRHPRVDVRLHLVDRTLDLAEEDLDVAVRVGALPDSSLIATRVGAIHFVTCAAPGYLAARGVPAAPRDLSDHDCITFPALAAADRWSFPRGKRRLRVPVRSRLVVDTAEAAVDAAVAGLGVVRLLSYQAAKAIADGSLRPILTGWRDAEIPVSLVHREGRFPQAKVRAFVAFAAARLRETLAALADAGAGRPASPPSVTQS